MKTAFFTSCFVLNSRDLEILWRRPVQVQIVLKMYTVVRRLILVVRLSVGSVIRRHFLGRNIVYVIEWLTCTINLSCYTGLSVLYFCACSECYGQRPQRINGHHANEVSTHLHTIQLVPDKNWLVCTTRIEHVCRTSGTMSWNYGLTGGPTKNRTSSKLPKSVGCTSPPTF